MVACIISNRNNRSKQTNVLMIKKAAISGFEGNHFFIGGIFGPFAGAKVCRGATEGAT